MHITHLQIKHFRCFDSLDLSLDNPLIVIEGINGAGKTSLLEALHYLCYLRSFRTHIPQELVQFGHDTFFIKARLQHADAQSYDLQVGFSNKKKLLKVNNKSIASYKELLDYYRIVTVTEDDMALIKEGPEMRRLFIDQALILSDADFMPLVRRCKEIVENRNILLKRGGSAESYTLWTQQLWQVSDQISKVRIQALDILEQEIKNLTAAYFAGGCSISFNYVFKKELGSSLETFMQAHANLYADEQRLARSLFGAHLDDFVITFKDIKSKSFASRGQQKLIVLLLKAAQIKRLAAQKGPAILLLDDFMTDLDSDRARVILRILQDLQVQLIFTVPTSEGFLYRELLAHGARSVKID